MFFSVITKNLNLEILTKNLVTFKRWDGVKYEKLNYGSSLKNPSLKARAKKNNISRVNYLKKGGGGLGQFPDLRGKLAKKREGYVCEGR